MFCFDCWSLSWGTLNTHDSCHKTIDIYQFSQFIKECLNDHDLFKQIALLSGHGIETDGITYVELISFRVFQKSFNRTRSESLNNLDEAFCFSYLPWTDIKERNRLIETKGYLTYAHVNR